MSVADIRFTSSATIQPSIRNHNHSTRRVHLTPWDLQLLLVNPMQKGILLHKPTTSDQTSLIDHLKLSLSLTLDIFYPLAGRLVFNQHHHDDHNTSCFVDCNDAGAHFVHAVADRISISDILDADYVPDIVDSFFLFNGCINYDGVSTPLLGVQVTELVDGFFIACTVNHSVFDGSSFWNFFNTWSKISRNSGKTNLPHSPPVFDRSCLNGIIHEFPIRFRLPEERNLIKPPVTHPPQRILHFSKRRIAELKAKANREMGTDKISSLQALFALLWRVVNRAAPLPPDYEVKYSFLIGTRTRLRPPLPDTYAGSAIQFAAASTTVGDLLSHGLGWAAWKINQVVASRGAEDEIKGFLENWLKNPDPVVFGDITATAKNTLSAGSSPRFDVYGNDFGWGKPIATLSGSANKFDGKLAGFQGKEEGSIDFECCLSKEKLQAMAMDQELLEALAP